MRGFLTFDQKSVRLFPKGGLSLSTLIAVRAEARCLLLAHSVVRCIAVPTVAIGGKADMPNEF
jgi:hypothetical protein